MDLVFLSSLNKEDYVIATYELEGTNSLADAAWELAIGQSVGNPNVRNQWETDDLFIKYSAKVIGERSNFINIKRLPIIFINDHQHGFSTFQY